MDRNGNGDTNCNWWTRYSYQRTGTGTGGFRNKEPNYRIPEIGQNTVKSPGDLRRLPITQTPMENHQQTVL